MRINWKKISQKIVSVSAVILLVGLVLGFIAGYSLRKSTIVSTYAIRDKTSDYKFIKPLLAVGTLSTNPTVGEQSLYTSVQKYIADNSAIGDNTSVYFIDYGDGGRFTINEKDLYAPSSLMKVVVMIAYFKKAETDPSILESKIVYQQAMQDVLDTTQFDTPSTLVVGRSYTVSDLIDAMITTSDNGAMNALVDTIGYPYLGTVYSALGLTGPLPGDANYKISANDYSLFFRVLYNATYLSPDMSEKALSILSKATFADGITAPLPQGTVVAHKFGEHVYGDSSSDVQALELHDCGIVYAKDDTYFLCVMTHGASLDALENRIQGISSLVYQDVTADPKNKQ